MKERKSAGTWQLGYTVLAQKSRRGRWKCGADRRQYASSKAVYAWNSIWGSALKQAIHRGRAGMRVQRPSCWRWK